MSKWREVRLGDVAILNGDNLSNKFNGVIKYIDISSVSQGNLEGYKIYDFKDAPSRARRKVKAKDIIYSTVRPNLKAYYMFPNKVDENLIVSTGYVVISVDTKYSAKYVYYYLTTEDIVNYFTLIAKGTSYPALGVDDFKNIKIRIPDLETQEKIANVLSSYDKLIENNNRRIELLENMAEEIYKEWFVRMRFPGYEKTKFEKGIPEGWEVKKIGDVTNIKYGNNLPTDKLLKNGYEVFGGNGIIGYYKDYMYKVPKILISCRGAASGKIVISNEYSYITNNSLILDSINDRCFEYFKMLFMNQDLSPYVTGSAQPQITITNIKKMKVILPTEKLINKLNNQLVSISSNISLLNKQNENIMKQRDMLLPRLMNGSVEVK